MKILAFLFFSVAAFGQNAVIDDGITNFISVTIGARHCFIWLHSATRLPQYPFEGACYKSEKAAPALQFGTPDDPITQTVNFTGGSIGWLIQPQPDGTLKIEISAKGPDDATETQVTFFK